MVSTVNFNSGVGVTRSKLLVSTVAIMSGFKVHGKSNDCSGVNINSGVQAINQLIVSHDNITSMITVHDKTTDSFNR